MDYVYAHAGVDRLLQRGGIAFMVLTHWHLARFLGIESTLKHHPQLVIYAPATWWTADRALLHEGADIRAEDDRGRLVTICRNEVRHQGPLILTGLRGDDGHGLYRLLAGVALKLFDAPMLLQTRGENVLCINVVDKGIVTVTSRARPGVMSLLRFAADTFRAPGLHGCYGGLHLSLFDPWKPEFDAIIDRSKAFGMSKIGCNACTGWLFSATATASGPEMQLSPAIRIRRSGTGQLP